MLDFYRKLLRIIEQRSVAKFLSNVQFLSQSSPATDTTQGPPQADVMPPPPKGQKTGIVLQVFHAVALRMSADSKLAQPLSKFACPRYSSCVFNMQASPDCLKISYVQTAVPL